MKCWDIATKNIKTCTPECTAKQAAQIMKDINTGIVPIVNAKNEIQGVVTDRDIIIRTIAMNKNPKDVHIKEFMSKPVITAHAKDNVTAVAKKMKKNQLRRIPIVDDANKLVGMISLGDMAVTAEEQQEACKILEKVSFSE